MDIDVFTTSAAQEGLNCVSQHSPTSLVYKPEAIASRLRDISAAFSYELSFAQIRDITQILALQQANLDGREGVDLKDGLVWETRSIDFENNYIDLSHTVVVKDRSGKVLAYLLTVPLENLDRLRHAKDFCKNEIQQLLTVNERRQNFGVCLGQVCVAASARRQGLAKRLYDYFKFNNAFYRIRFANVYSENEGSMAFHRNTEYVSTGSYTDSGSSILRLDLVRNFSHRASLERRQHGIDEATMLTQ